MLTLPLRTSRIIGSHLASSLSRVWQMRRRCKKKAQPTNGIGLRSAVPIIWHHAPNSVLASNRCRSYAGTYVF